MHAIGPDRARSIPTHCRTGCSPREPFPRLVRSGRDPTASSAWFLLLIRKGEFLLLSGLVSCGFSLSAKHSEHARELIGKSVTRARKHQVGDSRLLVRYVHSLKRPPLFEFGY